MTAKTAAKGFTPGPMRVNVTGRKYGLKLTGLPAIVNEDASEAIAIVLRTDDGLQDRYAYLFAASPDMLAALKLARSTIIASDEEEEHPLTIHALNAIDAAIKKAEAIHG